MVHVEGINVYRSGPPVSIDELVAQGLITRPRGRMYKQFYDLRSIHINPQESLTAFLKIPLAGLLQQSGMTLADVDFVIYARTFPSNRPVDHSLAPALFQSKGPRPKFFSITMGHCLSALLALQLASRLLTSAGQRGILITGEKCFDPSVGQIREGLMSEVATASLLAPQGGRFRIRNTSLAWDGRFCYGPFDRQTKNRRDYSEAFHAGLTRVWEQTAAQAQGVRQIIPFNMNKMGLLRWAQQRSLEPQMFYLENTASTGHAFCSDLMVNLVDACRDGVWAQGDTLAFLGAAMAGQFGACLIDWI